MEIGTDAGVEKHYYKYDGEALIARITILKVDKAEDILVLELDDIKTRKTSKIETTISKWQENNLFGYTRACSIHRYAGKGRPGYRSCHYHYCS